MAKTLRDVKIFSVGTWNQMKFVQEDLQAICDNTNKLMAEGKHKPPLKFGHGEQKLMEQEDGHPALGWVSNCRVEGQNIITDFNDVPDVVVQAIERSLYSQVSVELSFIQHFGWFITGCALLGADLPAVKNLDGLQAYLSDVTIAGTPRSISGMMCFSEVIINPKSIKDFMEMKDIEALQAKLALAEAQISQFAAKETEAKFTEAKTKILKPFEDDVKTGKLAPHVLTKMAHHLENQKATFKEGSLSISPEIMMEVAKAYSQPLPKGEQAKDAEGLPEERADIALENAILKIQTQTGKNYVDSLTLVKRANPGLVKAYKQFTIEASQGHLN